MHIFFILEEIYEDGELSGSHIRPEDADSNPFWQLCDTVHNFTDNQGIKQQGIEVIYQL